MRIYVAGPWVERPRVKEIAERFKAELGATITSRWFNHEGDPNDPTGATVALEAIQQQAREDIEDVLSADFLVVLNLAKSEGKAVETGIAIANEIPIISVGKRSNIFQALGREVDTVEEAIEVLRG